MIGFLSPAPYWFGDPPLLRLDPSSDTRTMTRRISRSSTLDGGSVINDGGYSQSDREIKLAINGLSAADAAVLESIAAYALCYLALDHGLYSGQVKGYAFNGQDPAAITFWVVSKIL
jgi:hypothetical protein